jgi:hypothetical protein
MPRHKVITTDAKVDRATERAGNLENEPRVVAVEYRPGAGLDLLILKLSDGHRQLIAREDLEGLQNATKEQIGHIEILGNGTGLHWPDLDLDFYIPALLRNVYGTRRWMSMIGRQGGFVRSAVKRRAAQKNGKKGGRPKRKHVA